MKTEPRVLYFSLNKKSVEEFYNYIDKTHIDRLCSFRYIKRKKVDNLIHASDLLFFLDNQKDVSDLYVIIDYPSFYNNHCDYSKEITLQSFSAKNAADIIRKAILKYPEVLFLFDESWNKNNSEIDFTDFLFWGKKEKFANGIVKMYHQYNVNKDKDRKESHPFAAITRERNNLFDGSRLRFRIKRFLYDDLQIKKYNFSKVQDSRYNNLALCIEEEHSQNRFNCYALYSNGFRVIPINSANELKYFNKVANKEETKPSIIVRDYDLQFSDENSDSVILMKILNDHVKINNVDYIRGAKHITKEDVDNNHPYSNRWFLLDVEKESDYDFWSNFYKNKTPFIFISKGGLKIVSTKRKYDKERKKLNKEQEEFKNTLENKSPEGINNEIQELIKKTDESIKNTETLFLEGTINQVVIGIEKPVSGVYYPFHFFKIMKDRYDASYSFLKECNNATQGTRLTEQEKEQEYIIRIEREKHNHGVPLDLYDLVKSMIERADNYYKSEKYIKAAITASEAIEILNGFHEALMLKAYHILAISENAIAMNAIGGSELELRRDAQFRIRKIENDVDRILAKEVADRRNLKYNILNQIFVDCRNFCQEKEHFKAEECFLSAIGHLNEGYTISDIVHEIVEIKEKTMRGLSQLLDFINS